MFNNDKNPFSSYLHLLFLQNRIFCIHFTKDNEEQLVNVLCDNKSAVTSVFISAS